MGVWKMQIGIFAKVKYQRSVDELIQRLGYLALTHQIQISSAHAYAQAFTNLFVYLINLSTAKFQDVPNNSKRSLTIYYNRILFPIFFLNFSCRISLFSAATLR